MFIIEMILSRFIQDSTHAEKKTHIPFPNEHSRIGLHIHMMYQSLMTKLLSTYRISITHGDVHEYKSKNTGFVCESHHVSIFMIT